MKNSILSLKFILESPFLDFQTTSLSMALGVIGRLDQPFLRYINAFLQISVDDAAKNDTARDSN